jgi:hypothetical protein
MRERRPYLYDTGLTGRSISKRVPEQQPDAGLQNTSLDNLHVLTTSYLVTAHARFDRGLLAKQRPW